MLITDALHSSISSQMTLDALTLYTCSRITYLPAAPTLGSLPDHAYHMTHLHSSPSLQIGVLLFSQCSVPSALSTALCIQKNMSIRHPMLRNLHANMYLFLREWHVHMQKTPSSGGTPSLLRADVWAAGYLVGAMEVLHVLFIQIRGRDISASSKPPLPRDAIPFLHIKSPFSKL